MNITEQRNPYYQIRHIKMNNDGKIKGVKDPLPKMYNHFMILCGQPGSGKTTWWVNLINKEHPREANYFEKFDRVEIFSNSFHTISEQINLTEDRIHDGLDDLEEVVSDIADGDDKTLIIFDDVVSDIKNDVFMQKLIWNRRHIGGGISIWLCLQVYNALPAKLRKSCNSVVLWNTSNKQEIDSIHKNFINMPKNNFYELLRYVYRDPHDFLFVDCLHRKYYRNFNLLTITE